MKNLTDILLQKFKAGDLLYSPLFKGPLTLESITTKGINLKYNDRTLTFDLYGRFFSGEGHCMLFPEKDVFNWNKYRPDLPVNTPVMIRQDSISTIWRLGWYRGKHKVAYSIKGVNMENDVEATHIVPVESFDFKTGEFSECDDYGTSADYEEIMYSDCMQC